MKLKLLALSTIAFAFAAIGHAQSDPYLVGLRASLPSTDTIHDAKIATLFEVWKDAHGVLQSNGYLEMGFKTSATASFVLTVHSPIATFNDNAGVPFIQAKGSLKNVTSGESTDVYVEWYMADNRKENSGTTAKNDVFAIHFWKPNTTLNFSSHWEFTGFHSVEVYHPSI